jgi:hypothetical protein
MREEVWPVWVLRRGNAPCHLRKGESTARVHFGRVAVCKSGSGEVTIINWHYNRRTGFRLKPVWCSWARPIEPQSMVERPGLRPDFRDDGLTVCRPQNHKVESRRTAAPRTPGGWPVKPGHAVRDTGICNV